MGRIYYASGTKAMTAAVDIAAFDTPATGMLCLHEIVITQTSLTADDSCEIILSRHTTAGSGGTATTPRPALAGAAASGVTVRSFDTTPAAGTETELFREGFSVLAGFQKIWTPETRIWVPPSGFLVAKSNVAIDSATIVWTAIFEEFD